MSNTPLFNTDWPERCPKCNEFFPTIIVGGVAGCIRCDDPCPTVHPPRPRRTASRPAAFSTDAPEHGAGDRAVRSAGACSGGAVAEGIA